MDDCDWDEPFYIVSPNDRATEDDIPNVFQVPQCDGNDVFELSADELQHLLSTGLMTSVSFVKHCLERIRMVGIEHVGLSLFSAELW